MSGAWIDHLRLAWKRPSAAAQRRWPEGTRLIELPNALVRVRVTGSGERTVLLTPDSPVVLENYDAFIAELAPHVRVVCFEFPGCGFSYPRFGFDFTPDAYVGVVEGIMDALAIPRATLAFTCVNALVAMAYARRHPDRVAGLVLAQVASVPQMAAFGKRIDFKIAGVSLLQTPVLGQMLMVAARAWVARAWYRIALPRGFDSRAIVQATETVFAQGGEYCLASLMQGQAALRSDHVDCPDCRAHVTWGMADRTHAKTDKDSIQAHLPQARIHKVEGWGHCPDLEAPAAYARVVLDALAA
jgi:pimeloyl-ACP methyl ester carboxylesterase